MECRVEFDYTAQEPDELTIKKGEIIKNVVSKMDGWYEGTLRGMSGVFPDNFVKVIEKPVPDPTPDKLAKSSEVVLRNNPNSARRVKVLFSYNPEQDDELTLDVGDVLDFIEEVEEGWWRGRLKGKEGIFPSNFVSEVDEPKKLNGNVDPSNKVDDGNKRKSSDSSRVSNYSKGIPDVVPASTPNQSIDDEPAPELPPKPVRELARCFFPYKASNEDELSLAEGDIITIISKTCEDEGWWRGELRGKIGVFPDNFVKAITPGEVHPALGSQTHPKMTAQERNVPPQAAATPPSELPLKAKKDSIGSSVVDGGGLSKSFEREKSTDSSSKMEQIKAKLSKSNSKEPPAPAPKVPATSPTIAAFHNNLFGNHKPEPMMKKEPPATHKDDKGSDESEDFNSVERTETLNHLTANRAKAPKRRPPSTVITRENENDIAMVNGSSHSFENSGADSPPPHHSTPINLSGMSNGTPSSGSHLEGDRNSSYTSRDKEGSPTPSSANVSANKPKKQTLPWMAELKQTQDKKRGIVSPGAPASASPAHSSPAPVTTTPPATTTTTKETPPPAATKAPPLPAKPSLQRETSTSTPAPVPDKVINNLNHVPARSFPKKSPSPAPPTTQNVSNHTSSSVDGNHLQHRGEGDSNSNSKGFVSMEEHLALKTRVTSLENEVESLKRQLKLLLDRDFRGHIV